MSKRTITRAELEELWPFTWFAKQGIDKELMLNRVATDDFIYEPIVKYAVEAHPNPPAELTMFLLKHGYK